LPWPWLQYSRLMTVMLISLVIRDPWLKNIMCPRFFINAKFRNNSQDLEMTRHNNIILLLLFPIWECIVFTRRCESGEERQEFKSQKLSLSFVVFVWLQTIERNYSKAQQVSSQHKQRLFVFLCSLYDTTSVNYQLI
jgi:hypothetical protein